MRNADSGLEHTSNPLSALGRRTAGIVAVGALVALAGCGTVLKQDKRGKTPSITSIFSGAKKGGGYYLDDGPGDKPPADLASIPDAVPRDEPLRPANMRPYAALGKWYTPMTGLESYRERGIASWYGRRYHGQKTASGEVYDMYGMTAAHTTLPIPSYARVTNIRNGKSIVVRVNDRGPFLSDRLIDLSYTAAYKLDVLGGGSAWVEVETILPGAGPTLQVATAPGRASNSASSPVPTLIAIPAPTREAGSQSLSLAANSQKRELKPDLFEADSAQAPSAALPVPASAGADVRADADAGGIYLQLGAFRAYDNADNFIARMRAALPSIRTLGIVTKDGLFKVHAGPYSDHAVARQAADKIAEALSIKPLFLVR
ncbi:septal ring lytic transglycosylase RlpA family protein [Nitrosospira briensis]|uniref:septal ring lytic transglycosylase RlpA family protein n=1 Tax=Nitrosospira briensis TaxID=35799 RepID=UPI0008F1F000|nr:septal ring lytic transglycosylase RlpA family protein [Nitrosospira briensis]SFN86172.1 rare lipoprotein A [Nitrosospira briensis]